MEFFSKSFKKSEKGQVLVFMTLTFVGLVAIIGLAIDTGYMYVSYSRLHRGVDAAALAGTGEFKKLPTTYERDKNIADAAIQMLKMNGINPDPTAAFSEPHSGTVGVAIETCDNSSPPDPVLCKTPLQKIIRVKVQERVPMFFLAVIGLYNVPIIVESLATAASADVMLAIDTSDSMTYDVPRGNIMRDPHACNPSSCQPMEDVKSAALAFANELYYPYDRLGLVSFDQYASMRLALSKDITEIQAKITAMTVFEGKTDVLLADGTRHGTSCIYYRDDPALNYDRRDLQNHVPPNASAPNTSNYDGDPYGPCRFFDHANGSFLAFDCPMFYGTKPDPSRCGSTNIGGGINLATRALLGIYPASYPTPSENREDSIWVLVLLTDGAANAAYDSNGIPVCPSSTWGYSGFCRDLNANARHSSSSTLYDAQDQARDMFDIAHQDNITIYTIGLGNLVTNIPPDSTGPAPGETLLKYPETMLANGKYFFAPSGTDLGPIFQTIANLITSRINQ